MILSNMFCPCKQCPGRHGSGSGPVRRGFTLLEMLVATAILVVGLAAVMRLVSISRSRSAAAAELAVAQAACQTKLSELMASDQPVTTGAAQRIDGLPNWRMTISVGASGFVDLAMVVVTAQQYDIDPHTGGIGRATDLRFDLYRWAPVDRVRLPDGGTGTGLFEDYPWTSGVDDDFSAPWPSSE